MEHAWRSLSGGKRIRAHANPLSDVDFEEPLNPDHVNVQSFFPGFLLPGEETLPDIKVADVGCGFAGLLVTLSSILPDTLCLGLEIRGRAVDEDQNRILQLRQDYAPQSEQENKEQEGSEAPVEAEAEESLPEKKKLRLNPASSSSAGAGAGEEGKKRENEEEEENNKQSAALVRKPFSNIWVVCSNAMRAMPNYFRKGQLEKLFFTFPDPHYKRAKHRRRVINQSFLAQYTYILKSGGLLYTITDVKDLHLWMAGHCDRHPLLKRLEVDEWKDDPCVEAMSSGTEEGQRVTKNRGKKYVAVYRRL